jgi:hypothetical protein
MPDSMGAYVRTALNNGTRPCTESDKRNKAFAASFKEIKQWRDLTITEKYCRVEGSGKDWYFHMPEALFKKSILDFYSNFCDYSEREIYQQAI